MMSRMSVRPEGGTSTAWPRSCSASTLFARPAIGDAARAMGEATRRKQNSAIRRWSIATARSNSTFSRGCAPRKLEERIELRSSRSATTPASAPSRKWPAYSRRRRPDLAVLIGNNQMEVLEDAKFRPSWCASATHRQRSVFRAEGTGSAGIEIAEPDHHGKLRQTYPAHPQLARHLIEQLVQRDFDVAASAGCRNPVLQHLRASARLRLHLPADHVGAPFRRCPSLSTLLSAQSAERRRSFRSAGRWATRSRPGSRICTSLIGMGGFRICGG